MGGKCIDHVRMEKNKARHDPILLSFLCFNLRSVLGRAVCLLPWVFHHFARLSLYERYLGFWNGEAVVRPAGGKTEGMSEVLARNDTF